MKTSASKAQDRLGVQVVYFGGINETRDRHLYHLADHIFGKGNGINVADEGCCLQGAQRRDIFWACKDQNQATALGDLFKKVQPGSEGIEVTICHESEHWERKMVALDMALQDALGDPAKR